MTMDEDLFPGPLAIGSAEDLLDLAANLEPAVLDVDHQISANCNNEVVATIGRRLEVASGASDGAQRVGALADIIKDVIRCSLDTGGSRGGEWPLKISKLNGIAGLSGLMNLMARSEVSAVINLINRTAEICPGFAQNHVYAYDGKLN